MGLFWTSSKKDADPPPDPMKDYREMLDRYLTWLREHEAALARDAQPRPFWTEWDLVELRKLGIKGD